MQLSLRLSSGGQSHQKPIKLEVAYRDIDFVIGMLAQLLPLLLTTPTSPSASKGGEGDLSHLPREAGNEEVDTMWGGGGALSPTMHPEHSIAASIAMQLRVIVKVDGISLSLFDDSQTNMLPLYQLSLGQLDAGVVVSLGSVGSRKEDGLKRVVSSLSLHIGANHFNPTNGEWEPMIEEWSMRAELEADFAEEEKIELIVEAPRPLQVRHPSS